MNRQTDSLVDTAHFSVTEQIRQLATAQASFSITSAAAGVETVCVCTDAPNRQTADKVTDAQTKSTHVCQIAIRTDMSVLTGNVTKQTVSALKAVINGENHGKPHS